MFKTISTYFNSLTTEVNKVQLSLMLSASIYIVALSLNFIFLILKEPWSNYLIQRLELFALLLITFSWLVFSKKLIHFNFLILTIVLPIIHIFLICLNLFF
jgi:hypothetical protein